MLNRLGDLLFLVLILTILLNTLEINFKRISQLLDFISIIIIKEMSRLLKIIGSKKL